MNTDQRAVLSELFARRRVSAKLFRPVRGVILLLALTSLSSASSAQGAPSGTRGVPESPPLAPKTVRIVVSSALAGSPNMAVVRLAKNGELIAVVAATALSPELVGTVLRIASHMERGVGATSAPFEVNVPSSTRLRPVTNKEQSRVSTALTRLRAAASADSTGVTVALAPSS